MSEPFWTPLGGQPVDYEGTYDPAIQYAPGDVVVYRGVTYLAVNPSLGSAPPAAGWANPSTKGVGLPLDRAGLLDTPDPMSDEFNVGPLAGKWVAVGSAAVAPACADPNVAPEGFQFRLGASTASPFVSYMQPLAGPATIYAKIAQSNIEGTSCRRGGIILGPANPVNTSPCIYFGAFTATAAAREVRSFRNTNWGVFAQNFASVALAGYAYQGPIWMKIQVLPGMLTYSTWGSLDGHVWYPGDVAQASGIGVAFGSVGIGFSTEGYGSQGIVTYDYFRVVQG